MLLSTLFAVASASTVVSGTLAAPLQERQQVDTPCHNVHVLVARGSYEDYTSGGNRINRLLVPEICKGRKSCGYEDIVYPATIGNDYCGSEVKGVYDGLGKLEAYAKRCPKSKIVLAGYSQGAQVVGDMLAGGGPPSCDAGKGPLNPNSPPGNKIKAVALFGDPRRTPGQNYNKGTAGKFSSGSFPRSGSSLTNIEKYGNKIRAYCNAGDPHCAGGGDGYAHEMAVEWNYKAAAKFINNKL